MEDIEFATFAGGCFWCVQHDIDTLSGVISTSVGYAGGTTANPTYEEVCSGRTGHVEALQIQFNPQKISYKELLDRFWHIIDPIRSDGQFSDVGSQYRPVIFYHSEIQKKVAEESKREIELIKKESTIRVAIEPLTSFYQAEEYHQKFSEKNPLHYQSYVTACGRKKKLEEFWNTD